MPKSKPRFTVADRERIRKHSIGKPTGVIAEIGGMEIDLVPLTTEQAGEVFAVLNVFSGLYNKANAEGSLEMTEAALVELVTAEGVRIKKMLRDVLHESALAGHMIDDEAVFDEWFNGLPIIDTVKSLIPKIVEASGLTGLLGNRSTPPSSPTAAGTTSP